MLAALETEIQYAASPLPDALQRAGAVAGPAIKSCIEAALAALRSGQSGQATWECLLTVAAATTALLPDDLAVLAPLGPQLGMTGPDDQTRHLRLSRTGLGLQLAKAEAEAERLGRLYRYGGPLAGCTAIVLLF